MIKASVIIVSTTFIAVWLIAVAVITGSIPDAYVPDAIAGLEKPQSTTELGGALGIIDGIFSSIAITLGLVAILYQGRELRLQGAQLASATEAQNLQVTKQVEANVLSGLIHLCERSDYNVDRFRKMMDEEANHLSKLSARDFQNLTHEDQEQLIIDIKESKKNLETLQELIGKFHEKSDRYNTLIAKITVKLVGSDISEMEFSDGLETKTGDEAKNSDLRYH